MQYALMFYAVPGAVDGLSEEELAGIRREYEALRSDPRCSTGIQLQLPETATTVRVAGGRTLMTDGPFADTKEVLGGIALVEAADLDEALAMAERVPAARMGGAVEVRPVVPA
jgi:hypothetical protein